MSTTTIGTVPAGTGGSSVAVTPGSGGTSAKGGTTSTGGTTAKGGTTASGGTSAKGGTTASGGTSAKGGTTAAGGTTSVATTAASTGGTSGGATVARLSNGTDGVTTRYWDCCKPSCGWTANASAAGKKATQTCGKDGTSTVGADTQSACSGGSAYQCFWGAPWSVSDTLSYGFAAFNGTNCGKCYQLDFTGSGDNSRASALSKKSMIVQAINIGDIGANHFDILIPGGGVGANNACAGNGNQYQWGNVPAGTTYGGFLTTCNDSMSCVNDMCTAAFGSKPALMAGCQWFNGWYNGASNPKVKYAEVPCPAAITAKSGM